MRGLFPVILILILLFPLAACQSLYGSPGQVDTVLGISQQKGTLYSNVASSFDSLLQAAAQATDTSTPEGKAKAAKFASARKALDQNNLKFERLTVAEAQALLSMKGIPAAQRDQMMDDLLSVLGKLKGGGK